MAELTLDVRGVRLAGEDSGAGRPIVLLHGLTATRRYVVMGSTALQRAGHRVIAYDARGHGASDPAASAAGYGYDVLADDLEAVLDETGIERAVLAGASMGAHTLLAFALRAPDRVAGLVAITPAYGEPGFDDPARLAHWDTLAAGLRSGGVDGFLEAYGEPDVPPAWRETVIRVIRQRLSQHAHPRAVADALSVVPRSRPFASVEDLTALAGIPAAVIASDDEADPGHPHEVGEAYARALRAKLVTDTPGRSPIAWQGSQVSRVITEVAARARW